MKGSFSSDRGTRPIKVAGARLTKAARGRRQPVLSNGTFCWPNLDIARIITAPVQGMLEIVGEVFGEKLGGYGQ